MAEIIGFPTQDDDDPAIWSCGDCGCLTFYIRADDAIECASCGNTHESPIGLWVEKPEVHEPVGQACADANVVVDFNTSAGALNRTVQRALDDIDGTVAVIVLKQNGDSHMWGDAMEGDQLDWFDRRIAVARKWFASRGKRDGSS